MNGNTQQSRLISTLDRMERESADWHALVNTAYGPRVARLPSEKDAQYEKRCAKFMWDYNRDFRPLIDAFRQSDGSTASSTIVRSKLSARLNALLAIGTVIGFVALCILVWHGMSPIEQGLFIIGAAIVFLAILAVAFFVCIAADSSSDPMEGKRRIYDKDGDVIGYMDNDDP